MNQDQEQAAMDRVGRRVPRLVILGVLALLGVLYFLYFTGWLSPEYLATQETALQQFRVDHPLLVYGLAFLIYVGATGLSLPGATILTLLMAWYFGFWRAVILVSFASTAGATLAFLLSRYLLRNIVQSRFGVQLDKFNQALDREGAFYLFTLRLIPAVPFFVINVVMGLTKMRVTTFWWVSQIGMFSGTCVYVYAGSNIPSLAQLSDPSQLRINDIADWQGFAVALNNSRRTDLETPAARVWERMPYPVRVSLNKSAIQKTELSRAMKLELVTSLNLALTQPDFALTSSWLQPVQPIENDGVDKDQQRRLTRLNRAALALAFPNHIGMPQPILSKKLLFAFVLLGVFPLIAKKALDHVRSSRA